MLVFLLLGVGPGDGGLLPGPRSHEGIVRIALIHELVLVTAGTFSFDARSRVLPGVLRQVVRALSWLAVALGRLLVIVAMDD